MGSATRQSQLETLLKEFRLPGFTCNYQTFARQAEKEKIDHVGYLYQLARQESEDRYNRRTEKLMKVARLLKGKQLTDLDFGRFDGIPRAKSKNSLTETAWTTPKTY